MLTPIKATRILLAFVIGSTIFADYWEYSKAYHANPDTWMDVLRGTADAPQQYRIGVPWVADLLRRHGHMGLRHGFTLVDLFCTVVAVYLLLGLFERMRVVRAASETARWFAAAAFVFLMQYYFTWITWYQRPETMASAAVLVATLWLLTVRLPMGKASSMVATSAAMLLLAAVQGFIRADVIFAAHLGVLLVCLTRAGDGFSLPRWVQAGTSALAVLIAGGVQFYLMHVVYPDARYGSTRVFQLGRNLTEPIGMVPFVLFLLPWGWVMMTLLRRRTTEVNSSSWAMLAGSAIYVAMWVVVGRIEEVRIFLPYAVALVPLTCTVALQRLVIAKELRAAE
jgi:hypothetical protein